MSLSATAGPLGPAKTRPVSPPRATGPTVPGAPGCPPYRGRQGSWLVLVVPLGEMRIARVLGLVQQLIDAPQVRRRRRGLADRLGFDADLAPLREIDWSRRAKDAVLIDGMDRSHGQAPTRSQRPALRLVLLTVLGADPRPRAGASRPAQMHAYRRRCADCAYYWEQRVCGRINQALIAGSRRSSPGVGATRLGSRSQEERVGSCPIARP